MKIATVIGARPQFIKASPVSRALQSRGDGKAVNEILIHTGQHYDDNMSQVFFDQLGLSKPKYNLGIGSGNHGEQTGKMLAAVEKVLVSELPDCLLVYGDTNSTLAGALAAAKLHISVAHVEAGLRSFNRRMPEELNRVIADHISDRLFAPTATAVANLQSEGIVRGVYLTGDVMQDAIAQFSGAAERTSTILSDQSLLSSKYLLITLHRAENTDDPNRLNSILDAFRLLAVDHDMIWPVHPRTRKALMGSHDFPPRLRLIDPVAYLDALVLERHAEVILTDSGGIQKEARWLETPCVTLRDETEWIETLEGGWNRLAGSDTDTIIQAVRDAAQRNIKHRGEVLGSNAAERIAEILTGGEK